MKFRIHPGANHYGESAFDFVDEWHRRELEIIVQRNLGETRGNAVALLNAQGQGTLSRSHYVDPDFYQLVCNEQIPDVAYLNAASISVPKREIQEAGRIVFAKEQKGKLSDREKLEIEGRARKNAAELINLPDQRGVIFGRNTTEVIGLTYYLAGVKDGAIAVSNAENASTYQAFQYNRDNGNPYRTDRFAAYPTWYSARGPAYPPMEEHKRDNKIARFELETDDQLYESLERAIGDKTSLLFFSHVLRSTGKEVPVAKICKWARQIKRKKNPQEPDIFIVVDGSQAVGNLPKVDFQTTGADAYAFTTYKTLGSPPIGILAFDPRRKDMQERVKELSKLRPEDQQILLKGMAEEGFGVEGNVSDSLSYADLHAFNSTIDSLPFARRSPNDFSALDKHRWKLRKYFSKKIDWLNAELKASGLSTVDRGGGQAGEVAIGTPTSFILSFYFQGSLTGGREEQIWQELTEAGAFCSCIAFDRLSAQASLFRVSFSAETTTVDIDRFMETLRHILIRRDGREFVRVGSQKLWIAAPEISKQAVHRNGLLARLTPEERDWRLYPDDGEDPHTISPTARIREERVINKTRLLQSDLQKKTIFDTRADWGWQEQRRLAYETAKHFPVLWISAPHIESKVNATFPGEPTPLLYATALLDRQLRLDEFPSTERVPKITAMMNPPVYNEQFERSLIEHLKQYEPRVVGISNISEGHHYALRIAKLVKEHSPNSVVIIGGSHEDNIHPTGYKRASERAKTGALRGKGSEVFALEDEQLEQMDRLRTLANPDEREWIDFVISGDAPCILVELMKIIADNPGASQQELKGKVMEQKNRIAEVQGSGFLSFYDHTAARVEDLPLNGHALDRDKLPYIDRRRLTHENRFPVFDYKKTVQVMAGIGCKYSCEFCCESADSVLQGVPKLQSRSPANVAKELRSLKQQGYEAVFFDDSTFTQSPTTTGELLDLMIQQKMGVEWGCQTTINDLNEQLVAKMAKAGCSYIYFGFEQASAEKSHIQKAEKTRSLELPVLQDGGDEPWTERFRRVASWCKKNNVRVGTSLQFGLGEAEEDRRHTIDVVAQLVDEGMIPDGSVALNINALYPGTVQWIRAMKTGGELPDYRDRLERDPRFETAHQFGSLKADDIEKIYQYASEKLGDALVK
ncbi:MAG: aminotransferase class V-fold PLP-dependent enzyme [Patescibacteria group bacterium]